MGGAVFSQNWFKVAKLRPRLRSHARIYRQRYRGGTWFVVQDDQTGRYHRLAPAANRMIGLMDGRRTMDQIWNAANAWIGEVDDPPTQDETIRMLAHLHQADLLSGDMTPDIEELTHRADSRESKALMARLKNPLALRLPLWDPDRFLDATMPLIRPLFTVFGAVVWLAVVIGGLAVAVLNWPELSSGFSDRVFLAENLILMALVYPFIKALHEFGHGYAIKRWGGEVREMGLMFLVLIPVPYVDASASSGFQSKWSRAVVGGAGILVEIFIAAIAIFVWAEAEPGLIRAAAFNTILIGSVSTLLFNGNPLLRFDGYYVLSDLVEIPNLGNRANAYVFYVIKKYLFGMRDLSSPVTARGEQGWFLFYAVAAFLYRLSIMIGIALFIAGKLFFIGVGLAIWAVLSALVFPVIKGLWWLIEAPELRSNRARAMLVSGTVAFVALAGFLALPLPYATMVEGVIDVPESAVLRTSTEGFLENYTQSGEVVKGAQIMVLANRELTARRDLILAQRAEIWLKLEREIALDRASEGILRQQLEQADATLARVDDQIAGLTLTVARSGRLVVPDAVGLLNSFVERGTLVGYVIAPGDLVVRSMVPQGSSDLVRHRLNKVEIMLADKRGELIGAELVRQIPQATRRLASVALGTEGGGRIVIDPTSGNAQTALEPLFQFDLSVPLSTIDMKVGQRVFVRFDHGAEPLFLRIVRNLRQLFLSKFDV
ncbi:peptidase M50 [Puniceibacterium sediminis]|uniref:Putative peptide zinc metalloprotease protein n=1 Tax=Puniceibacterium sediminis TaxID=1608407 RepID=A0A238Z9N4_9RHOB|nr:peptidase M50 [Puniceibacterium sediminis]SNR79802.1 putative peptide zinc metalloprotease protein [Puniceibacterium sediminis]